MTKPKKIFISPLDWGLGHTTRCIPIAQELHKQGHSITFGVNEVQKSLLTQELDFGNYTPFEGYNIQYPKGSNMAFKMLLESPKILKRIKSEHLELQTLIDKHNFDLIISDNRFGLHSKKIPCSYVTHQINIQGPKLIKKHLHKIHGKYINQFSKCWIPDSATKNNLGGELSHGNLHPNCSYINPLSRFNKKASSELEDIEYLAILSGPEPQRSEFEAIIIRELKKTKAKCVILGGKPLTNENHTIDNIEYFPHLDSKQLYKIMCRSKKVICRPGYSSIMDLSVLQKPVHFIPTPGQTEQEYLASLHGKEKGWSKQDRLDLSNDIKYRLLPEIENDKLELKFD